MTTSASIFGFSSNLTVPICLATFCCFILWLSEANDTLRPGENLTNTETLVSSNGAFELGFFRSRDASSSNYYLGIWFMNDPNKKAVWVASRKIPIIGSNGALFIRYDGNLVITDKSDVPIIINSGMLATSSNTSAILLDSGNLILKGVQGIVWQSFYNPSDTFLPGMRLGWSKIVANPFDTTKQFLVSWQSPQDPAFGSFALGLDISNRTLLKVWHGDGISREIGFWDGQRFKFFIQVSDKKKNRRLFLVIVPVLGVSLTALVLLILFRCRGHQWFKASYWNQDENLELFLFQIGKNSTEDGEVRSKRKFSRQKDHELPLLSFASIAASTNHFSFQNKIGEGGFGPVYKGAVKRLSSMSGQGLEEFKNEVRLISRIQHRNLVRLLACCVQKDEKILVYEYMPNKSLDSFLFDPTKQIFLDWERRFSIVEGIAQELLYLHKYSRLRIIHRDLKTTNILMNEQMNPKISDFGMARTFGDDEIRTRTTRVVGTFGYMSPEYTMHGFFSIKSDVYSFGVIVLEIVSGRKNVTFTHDSRIWNLLGYAWDLWKDDRISDLMDPTLASSVSPSEFMLCIQLCLLCVQERPEDRPTMSDVISMLGNESMNLPVPKEPAFWTRLNGSSSSEQPPSSQNNVTFSSIVAR